MSMTSVSNRTHSRGPGLDLCGPPVHHIGSEHILLPALDDGPLVQVVMNEHEGHSFLRPDGQVSLPVKRLVHTPEEPRLPTRHLIVQIDHEGQMTFFPYLDPFVHPIAVRLEGLTRTVAVEAPPLVEPGKDHAVHLPGQERLGAVEKVGG